MTRDPLRVKMRGWSAEGERMARDDDDPLPRKRARLEKLALDTLGIEELRDYIDELRAEILRVEADIARKGSHRTSAEAFFRRP
jgi:uncharacterized small protein (DUF1192 family)